MDDARDTPTPDGTAPEPSSDAAGAAVTGADATSTDATRTDATSTDATSTHASGPDAEQGAGSPDAVDTAAAAPGGTAARDDAVTDHAVARLRAADPAADVEPDAARLRARLAAATGLALDGTTADPSDATSPAPASGAAPADELAAARARRRPARWLQVAAVAAGVALVGGGGYAVGAAGGTPSAPPIALGAASPGGAQELAAADARMALPGWGGRTVFHGSGLKGAKGSARAWAFDPTGVATAETVARVAQVLGVEGEPRQEWGQWTVGANDGLSASVQVGVDGQASLWFYDRAWDPSVCTVGVPETMDGGGVDGAEPQGAAEPGIATVPSDVVPSDVAPARPELAPELYPQLMPGEGMPSEPAPADPSVCDPASTPRGDAAVARARELVEQLGGDVAGYEFTVSEETGVDGLVSVTGTQVVDGTQTGLGWSVQLAGTGVQSVSGPLAPIVDLGTYDHVSADEAVERLNDPRFGASYGGVVPLAAREGVEDTSITAPADEPTLPSVPGAGDPIAWPVQDVTITGARLGVTQLFTPDGALLLVPAWELTDTDGGTWSVVAVVEDQLDLGGA